MRQMRFLIFLGVSSLATLEMARKTLMKSKKKERRGSDEMLNDMNDFHQSLTSWRGVFQSHSSTG